MKSIFWAAVLILLFCFSCTKGSYQDSLCSNIQNVSIAATTPVKVGDKIIFYAPEVGGNRIYSWVGPNNYASQYPKDSIVDAQFQNEGWYFLQVYAVEGNCTKIDSIYVDVTFQQETIPCVINNNTATYNNLAVDNFSSVTKKIDPVFSEKSIEAYSGLYSSTTIYFHPNWRTFEPEDGVYFTTNTPFFFQTDFNYNKVCVTATKNSIYWTSNEGQKVYVSHIGSKLQVRYCNLIMGGNNGTSYTTIASGNLIEQ
jgi:hypothetical protein